MGAVKNHFHDEICAMPESDGEPHPAMRMADLTPLQVMNAAKAMTLGASLEMPDCIDQRMSERGKDVLRTVIEIKIHQYLWGLRQADHLKRQAERNRDPRNDYDPAF